MGRILEILSLIGVKKVTIAWVSLMILTGTTASSITIFMIDFNRTMTAIETLSEQMTKVDEKLSVYISETDKRIEKTENAITNISTLHEKQDKDYYDFTKSVIQDVNSLTLLYEQKIMRLQDLHNFYLPTKYSNSFTIEN